MRTREHQTTHNTSVTGNEGVKGRGFSNLKGFWVINLGQIMFLIASQSLKLGTTSDRLQGLQNICSIGTE